MKCKMIMLTILALALGGAVLSRAGDKPPQGNVLVPIVPLAVRYSHVPQYFMQVISNSPQYTRIEAYVDRTAKTPSIQIMLAPKNSYKPITYCDSREVADALNRLGREAYFVPIDAQLPKEISAGSKVGFAFRDKTGQPILWRFIAMTEVSAMGSGLTPLGKVPGLRLSYRERGALAGPGSAVKIGEELYEAEVWTELSHPPEFVPYRGSYTEGLDSGEIGIGSEEWQVISAPSQLERGAQWVISSTRNRRTLTVTEATADRIKINQTDTNPWELTTELTYARSQAGFGLSEISITDHSHTLQMTFNPPLPPVGTTGSTKSAFTINQGKQRGIASGEVSYENAADGAELKFQFRAPDWAKGRVLTSKVQTAPGKFSFVTTQTSQ